MPWLFLTLAQCQGPTGVTSYQAAFVSGSSRSQSSSSHKSKDFLLKTAFLWPGQVFLVCHACSDIKSSLILTSDPFLMSSFCIKQTAEVLVLPLISRWHLSSGFRLHFLFQVNAGWYLPHPTLCSGLCAVLFKLLWFSSFWLLALCDRVCWFSQA